MPSSQPIIIFGASVRAAAFSALRAGLQPWCADLFADADLLACCPVVRIESSAYPKGFMALSTPSGPWMYTGGLENHPRLVESISSERSLWGNGARSLSLVRSPFTLAKIFRANGIPFPIIHKGAADQSQKKRWLMKPLKGAGGVGIHFHNSSATRARGKKHLYCQEFVEGLAWSAVFVGLKQVARFLGATQQLIGEAWLNAVPFHYCGSIGPLRLDPPVHDKLEKIGNVLAQECRLRGLFGVDFILSDGIPWPVEVNPRYPASVEILEYALGIKAMASHCLAFDADMPELAPLANAPGSEKRSENKSPFVGKAILFAKRPLKFPKDGPWTSSLRCKRIERMPDFADVPVPGQLIKAQAPILTFFAQSTTMDKCLGKLKERAQALDHYLWKP